MYYKWIQYFPLPIHLHLSHEEKGGVMAWSKKVSVLVVWSFLLVGDKSRRALSSTFVPFSPMQWGLWPHSLLLWIPSWEAEILAQRGSPVESTPRETGWRAWAVHSSTSLPKKPVGNSFLCQSAASEASVRECCDGMWLWRAALTVI